MLPSVNNSETADIRELCKVTSTVLYHISICVCGKQLKYFVDLFGTCCLPFMYVFLLFCIF
jgi:hypothetical protein